MTTLPRPDPAPEPRPRRSKGPILTVIVLVIAGALVAAWGIVERGEAMTDLDARDPRAGDLERRRHHAVARDRAAEEVALPGNIQPYTDAAIFARTTGYLKARYADIGSKVKAGQLLAEIDTPEIDQQLLQARADLATAKANEGLAQTTAERYQDLIKTDSVSRQDLDNANGSYEAKKAAVLSEDANVNRLEELQRFKTIYAPFDGVITARNTDIGALIGSGSGAKELFHIAPDGPAARLRGRAADLFARGAAQRAGDDRGAGVFPGGSSPACSRARPSRSTRGRAPCSSRSTWTTPAARSCRGRSRRCTSSCRPMRRPSGCR